MANAKKVGALIKSARLGAGLTQEQLARKVKGAAATDIGKAERGEKELTADQLKQIARATGVTQKSLLDAAKPKTSSSTSKPASGALTVSMKVTASEKKLVELYRAADSATKKEAVKLLKGSAGESVLESLLGGALDALAGKRSLEPGEAEPEEE